MTLNAFCKMKTETPPTIAELWGELSTRHLRESERLQWDHMRENGQITEDQYKGHLDYVQSLRQQLLERCSVPCYNFSASPLEEIEYHKEMSSIHGFWAWELEQQKREAQNEQ